MIARQPYLPRFMAGGPSNPLGARALYLGNSIYRIHGTNAPSTIGGRVSSGCIRMLNDDVVDLYGRVKVGSKVVVLPDGGRRLRDIARPVEPRAPRQAAKPAPEPVATRAQETAPLPQAARETEQLSSTRRTAATPTILFLTRTKPTRLCELNRPAKAGRYFFRNVRFLVGTRPTIANKIAAQTARCKINLELRHFINRVTSLPATHYVATA